jgi:hypothetical protein
MKQIRLYLDEDAMSHSLTKGLRARGIEVLTPLEVDLIGKKSSEEMQNQIEFL